MYKMSLSITLLFLSRLSYIHCMKPHPVAPLRADTVRLMAFLLIIASGVAWFSGNTAHAEYWNAQGFLHGGESAPINSISFTSANRMWINHDWLSLQLLNRCFAVLGSGGLMILQILCGFALLRVCSPAIRERVHSESVRLLLMMLFIAVIGTGYYLTPGVFSWLIFAGLLRLLNRDEPPLWLPILMVGLGCLWANLNGLFFTGLMLLATTALCAAAEALLNPDYRRRQYAMTLAAAACGFFLGTLFTPFGIHLWTLVFQTAGFIRPHTITGNTLLAPLHHFLSSIPFWILLLITLLGVTGEWQKMRPFAICVLLLCTVMAFTASHFMPLAAIAYVTLAPECIASVLRPIITRAHQNMSAAITKTITLSAIVILILIGIWRTPGGPNVIHIPARQFPVGAITFLQRNAVSANALVYHPWTGLIATRMPNRIHLFMDCRSYAAYPAKAVNDYLRFISESNTDALEQFPTDLVLIPPDLACSKRMNSLEGWTSVYQDTNSIIFLKTDIHADLIRRQALNMVYIPEAVASDVFP